MFVTEEGIKLTGITSVEMKKLDDLAMENNSPNLFQMMENAGRNLAELTISLIDDYSASRILVLAGKGGNGGGGICSARHLANKNIDVHLCLIEPDKLSEVANEQLNIYSRTDGKLVAPDELQNHYDIILDAMLGYSLKGEPANGYAQAIEFANESNAKVIALDIPSGIDASTGKVKNNFIKANYTLTLAYPKVGLKNPNCGKLFLGDIGIPSQIYKKIIDGYINPFGNKWLIKLKREQS